MHFYQLWTGSNFDVSQFKRYSHQFSHPRQTRSNDSRYNSHTNSRLPIFDFDFKSTDIWYLKLCDCCHNRHLISVCVLNSSLCYSVAIWPSFWLISALWNSKKRYCLCPNVYSREWALIFLPPSVIPVTKSLEYNVQGISLIVALENFDNDTYTTV